MEIIEHREWSKDIGCRCCTSQLRISQSDIRLESINNEKRGAAQPCIICPVCEAYNWLEWDELPRAFTTKLSIEEINDGK